MTQSFINPLSKFTSDTLKTLPYSRLYFYENQSSTPKQVYKDKNKTISWGFYAESDSAGNFAPIWYDGVARAELRWSPNWATTPVGVVQTGWPIDWIGTAQTFDTSIVINGSATANGLISTTSVAAAGNAGFVSSTYNLNARNPIWSFGNAPAYGISYFAGTPSIGTADSIGIHFGTATLIASQYKFDQSGNFAFAGALTTGGAATINGNQTINGSQTITGSSTAANLNATVNISAGGTVAAAGNISSNAAVSAASTVSAATGVIPGNSANVAVNVLDYYLEGTFTPVAVGSAVAGVGTYAGFKRTGTYTRIGNRVFFRIAIGWSAHTGTGDLLISGLPFTASSYLSTDFACATTYYGLLVAAGKTLGARVVNGNTYIQLSADDPAGGGAFTAVAMDTAVGELSISGHYEV
ncbi:MAG: hypothetical protein V4440_12220 [Pseudomonadota bacterium]